MKRIDHGIAWLIILLGVRFALVAPREFSHAAWPWAVGFWLVNCAVLFITCGALNLVRIRYGSVAPGLRAIGALLCISLATLQGIAGVVGGETAPAIVVAVVLLLSAAFNLHAPPRRFLDAESQ
jgi:hypothetical protein